MKILLIGEYSNVHATLADGLRVLGHEVTVVSNGDFWKNYPRDIDLTRDDYGKWGGIVYMLRLAKILPKLKGYDVVQFINPKFLELKIRWTRLTFEYLRRNNKKLFLAAYGQDWYWVHENITSFPLRYSDFNFGKELRTDKDAMAQRKEWLGTPQGEFNKYMVEKCQGVIAGLYEYWACYHPYLDDTKLTYIPFPIKPKKDITIADTNDKVRIFIGINKERSVYKGTDIMLRAAEDVLRRHPDKMELIKAESVPFNDYVKLMSGCDAIIDQLYAYTPSMNPLEAMSRGLICIGGGEPENYEIINETELRPIINVQPNYESVYHEIEQLVSHPERVPELRRQSIEYINKHHDYIKVAKRYEEFFINGVGGI